MTLTGEAKRSYQREWVAKRRAEWFADKTCIDCGRSDALQLDHVDPSDKVTHRIWSWSKARRLAELAKCVARCGDCHLAKTRANRETCHDGAANGSAQLTAADVVAIRMKHAAGRSTRSLATEYGVGSSTIFDAYSGKKWKSIRL